MDLVRKRTRSPSESEASSSAAESSSDDDGSDDEGSGDDESDSGSSVTSSDEGDASDDASEDDVEIESEELEAMEGDELEPTAPLTESKRARKRKRDQEEEALENEYVQRLHEARDEERRDSKRAKQANGGAKDSDAEDSDTEDSENEDSDDKDKDAEDTDSESDAPPMHESLVSGEDKAASSSTAADLERASRTVFLGNVSTTAITSPSARRTLEKHLSSVLNPDPEDEGNNDEHSSSSSSDSEDGVDAKQSSDSNGAAATAKGRTKRQVKRRRIESLRFRSIPFATTSMPKRAAYATSAIMTATTAATHAYAVYPTEADARLAVSRLNGTIVLGRHLRADSVAHPSPVDHRRCVFVGNLNFVDDESVYRTRNVEEKDEDGDSGKRKKGGKFRETTREKRTKVPGDVEEGLWRVFGEKAGKVESVRVVRDEKTRVGKGFAYVQFYVSYSPR